MKAFSLIGECAEKSELVRRLVVAVTSDVPVIAPVSRLPLSDISALGDFVMAHAVAPGE